MNTANIIAARHAAAKLAALVREAHTDAVNTGSLAEEALCFDLIGDARDLETQIERTMRACIPPATRQTLEAA